MVCDAVQSMCDAVGGDINLMVSGGTGRTVGRREESKEGRQGRQRRQGRQGKKGRQGSTGEVGRDRQAEVTSDDDEEHVDNRDSKASRGEARGAL
jgi:hypothetical protein